MSTPKPGLNPEQSSTATGLAATSCADTVRMEVGFGSRKGMIVTLLQFSHWRRPFARFHTFTQADFEREFLWWRARAFRIAQMSP